MKRLYILSVLIISNGCSVLLSHINRTNLIPLARRKEKSYVSLISNIFKFLITNYRISIGLVLSYMITSVAHLYAETHPTIVFLLSGRHFDCIGEPPPSWDIIFFEVKSWNILIRTPCNDDQSCFD